MQAGETTTVKVFVGQTPGSAVVTTQDKTIRYAVVLDETLMNKMCRKDRAFFNATLTPEGVFALHRRLPNQKW